MEEILKTGKPVIFVNVSGSCVNLSRADEACDAVVQCFYPGAEGGAALADVLFGKVNPQGRLPVTFYRSTEDLPPFEDYNMENRTYKYFDGSALYPFGYGLSYTSFAHTLLHVDAEARLVRVSVKNTGGTDGTDTVCVFLKKVSGESRERYRLIGIGKAPLAAGETREIEIAVDGTHLAELEKGEYEIAFAVEN